MTAVNILIMSDSEATEYVNSYFASIGTLLADRIPEAGGNFQTPLTLEENGSSFSLRPITLQELHDEIKNIQTSKSSGIPDIASRIWKIALLALDNQFLYIVNKSIESGEYPSAWKIPTIVPIPKVANPTEAADLCPVALLPIPGKIVEKVVHKQMINFLEEHKYLDPKQNGFRSKHSTEETIFDFTSDLTIAKNKKLDSLALFVDFKKAFDTVNHKILSNKLRSYNFGDSR